MRMPSRLFGRFPKKRDFAILSAEFVISAKIGNPHFASASQISVTIFATSSFLQGQHIFVCLMLSKKDSV